MITVKAEDVVSNARSLLAKANKTTGKEHKSLSEAFEDLNLGYGVDQTEAFDGNIELEGEFEPGEKTIIDYYEEGKADGVEELPDLDAVKY